MLDALTAKGGIVALPKPDGNVDVYEVADPGSGVKDFTVTTIPGDFDIGSPDSPAGPISPAPAKP